LNGRNVHVLGHWDQPQNDELQYLIDGLTKTPVNRKVTELHAIQTIAQFDLFLKGKTQNISSEAFASPFLSRSGLLIGPDFLKR
jgi:hypothetical protein